MKPGINVISVFEKKKDESGNEYFTGSLDVKALKKMKCEELRVVLIGKKILPPGLQILMSDRASADNNLIMFAENGPVEL